MGPLHIGFFLIRVPTLAAYMDRACLPDQTPASARGAKSNPGPDFGFEVAEDGQLPTRE